MKRRKSRTGIMALSALLILTLAACAASGAKVETPSGTQAGTQSEAQAGMQSVAQGDAQTAPQGEAESGAVLEESADVSGVSLLAAEKGAHIYENDGMKLSIPEEYDGLVTVDTGRDGVLFSVAEKASIAAAKAQGEDYDGAGWLFSVARVSEETLREELCYDMSGAEAFAKDAEGRHYMYYYPTDVRFVRERYEGIDEDMRQWSALTEWAESAAERFLADNPGLTAERYGNTSLDMYFARIAYLDEVNYVISMTDYGPLAPDGVDAAPYVERLMRGVTFELAEGVEAPDGEYVVLMFPDDGVRFDFFLMDSGENYVREVWNEEYEQLYKASYADGTTSASEIMNEWYDALVKANHLGE